MRKISSIYISWLWVKVKSIGAFSKLCRLLHKTVVYQSKTGLKEINPAFAEKKDDNTTSCMLSPGELYLGVDFLKDEYTLIDVPITESPHYGLMSALSAGKDGRDTQYVMRMLTGALDERYEIVAFYLDCNYFRNCFEKRINSLNKDDCAQVTVYRRNGRYYIHDGKHRAALCALLGTNVKCKIIDFDTVCGDFNPRKLERLKKGTLYMKHHRLFKNKF